MEKIWEFFENMDEFVYVADADTYEMIYLNRKAREEYGIGSLEDLRGKKCYELLQNSALPCAICNNSELEVGQFKEWRYFDPIIGRDLAVKNTIVCDNGRRCRVQIGLDASGRDWNLTRLRGDPSLMALVNECLCTALRSPSPDQSLNIVLEYIGKALEGKRTYIFERNASGRDNNTYEWVAKGVKPEKEALQNIPHEVFADLYRKFDECGSIAIRDVDSIRESAPHMFADLTRQGVCTLVVVPLHDDRKIIGFSGVENLPAETIEDASNMLQIMGHFIVSSFKRRNLIRQLREMSYHDQLTHAGNRHALWEYVKTLRNSEDSLGIVYCDVTGLKYVNDTQGHQAGDRLIVNACQCLVDVFGKKQVFRIGGDELLVILPGVSETVLQEQVKNLRECMEEYKVIIAVGVVWHAGGNMCFNKLLTDAEHLMYQDKADYYRKTGIERRH